MIRFTDGDEELYDLSTDPYETTDLLAGTLGSGAQANYYALVLKLPELQDTVPEPETTVTLCTAASFSATVKQSSGTAYALWRSTDPGSLSRAPVMGATSATGSGVVTLTDPAPPGSRSYYRMVATVA